MLGGNEALRELLDAAQQLLPLVEAADVQDLAHRRIAEIHRLHRRARVHAHQALAQQVGLLGAHQVGLGEENAVGKAHLLLVRERLPRDHEHAVAVDERCEIDDLHGRKRHAQVEAFDARREMRVQLRRRE